MARNEFLDGSGKAVELTKDDFKLVQADTKIHDVKFNRKPTTFFKDAMKRFAKSKSSLVGGAIVGLLVVLAIVVPVLHDDVGVYKVENTSQDPGGGNKVLEKDLGPKLFDAGSGFWDGTYQRTAQPFDNSTGLPVSEGSEHYTANTVYKLETYEVIENAFSVYGSGGYQNLYCPNATDEGLLSSVASITFDPSKENTLSIEVIEDDFGVLEYVGIAVSIQDASDVQHYVLGGVSSYEKPTEAINISAGLSETVTGKVVIHVGNTAAAETKGHVVIGALDLKVNGVSHACSFPDGNTCMLRDKTAQDAWISPTGSRSAYKVHFTYCNFLYDKYEDVYGTQVEEISYTKALQYSLEGIIRINLSADHCEPTTDAGELALRFEILDDKLGFYQVVEQTGTATYKNGKWTGYKIKMLLHKYKLMGYEAMPRFIFGTNGSAKDYCKLMFQGMRLSFLIAIGVSAVNIVVGLIWGSISGYFGGTVDLVMERITDIIAGLPGTVIITLCILYGREWQWGQMADVIALMISLFLTGWMGVAARTRTQFYRFKGREYVLASRTLGAKDSRLIFKHILPNSAGTIITGSILMIPSVIYTEASIAYLGLGLKDQCLFGVVLAAANDKYKGDLMYQLVIPTIIMTLLLVSFNLFGNGLRDAFNPSLKGEE